MKNRGQVSLEYLIVVGAFLAMLLVFMPLLVQTHHTGLFGIDAVKAEKFTQDFKSAVDELNILGNGSRTKLTANPVDEWSLQISGNKLILTVKSTELERIKKFEVELKNIANQLSKTISSKTTFLLEKSAGKITIRAN